MFLEIKFYTPLYVCSYLQGGPKKRGHRLVTIILSNLNRYRFLGNIAVKCILKIPPHLAHVGTLPCEILMSAKQAVNDKLQSIVSTYLRCHGVVNNRALSPSFSSALAKHIVHKTITFLLVTLPSIHWFYKNFHPDSAVNLSEVHRLL